MKMFSRLLVLSSSSAVKASMSLSFFSSRRMAFQGITTVRSNHGILGTIPCKQDQNSGTYIRRREESIRIGGKIDFSTFLTSSSAMMSTMSSDESATARSRAPFRMPNNSPDDSTSKGKNGKENTWNELGLWQELLDSLEQLNFPSPTPVQAMAIPTLLRENKQLTTEEQTEQQKYSSLAFLAATGSGKTIAYVLPILQQLKNSEVFDEIDRPKQRPRCVILAPTRELVLQIKSVIKTFCHSIKLSCQSLTAKGDASSYSDQKKLLNRQVDIVVATPGQFIRHWKDGNLYISKVQHVVLDEMDTLLEQGFQSELREILYPMLYKPEDISNLKQLAAEDHNMAVKLPMPTPTAPRLILTSATMTQAIQKILGEQKEKEPDGNSNAVGTVSAKKLFTKDPKQKIVLPTIPVMKAPGLHKAVPRLEQVFIDCGNVDKISLLVDTVASSSANAKMYENSDRGGTTVNDQKQKSRPLTMVFCNTAVSCRAVQFALAEARMNSLSYHGELNSVVRSENLRRFRSAHESSESNQPRILVCTDLAARGIDIPEVDHVVMFDFPLNSFDYIHRSGRTARGDRISGKVSCLVTKRDRVLATAIENAVLDGRPLDGLSSRKSDYLPGGKLNRRNLGSNSKNKRSGRNTRFSQKSKSSYSDNKNSKNYKKK